jgi:hypothetical protein
MDTNLDELKSCHAIKVLIRMALRNGISLHEQIERLVAEAEQNRREIERLTAELQRRAPVTPE